jgi:hypothetical protein
LEQRVHTASAHEDLAAREGHEERRRAEDSRCRGRAEVAAGDEPRPPPRINEAAKPEREHRQVDGDAEVEGGGMAVDHFDGGEEVQREERSQRCYGDRRGARAEPAGREHDADNDEEDQVRGCGLHERDADEDEAQRHGGVEVDHGEGDHCEKPRAGGKLESERRRIARQRERERHGEEKRACQSGGRVGAWLRGGAPNGGDGLSDHPLDPPYG